MDIEKIRRKYGGCIALHEPCALLESGSAEALEIPEELRDILRQSNGIEETMKHPVRDEMMPIGFIIYTYEEIVKLTAFYREQYGLAGTVFSDDGTGDPYYLKDGDGAVFQFHPIDDEHEKIADSLEEFFS